jgi:2-polyprenyl-3-methyl-5-hydroxy-6-metoxy-1,4-benzoquinol methylase
VQRAEIQARDERAATYAADYRLSKGAWWDELECDLLVNAIEPRDCKRILDVGSGAGRVARKLSDRGCTVHSFDFSFESLRVLGRSSQHAADT